MSKFAKKTPKLCPAQAAQPPKCPISRRAASLISHSISNPRSQVKLAYGVAAKNREPTIFRHRWVRIFSHRRSKVANWSQSPGFLFSANFPLSQQLYALFEGMLCSSFNPNSQQFPSLLQFYFSGQFGESIFK